MSDDHLIENVSDTSFWVAYYRAKESLRPDSLFKDPFAQLLVGDRGKNISDSMAHISRYTEWSVISRTVIIDRFIADGIKNGVDAIINLGAGLDTRPYRMDLPKNLEWVEVDYPNIISHKEKILKDEVPKCKLTRVTLDLADSKKRGEFLEGVLPSAKKILIITEGVIIYLSPNEVEDLAKDLLKHKRFTNWITEYFHPRVYPYLQNTIRASKMKNAPFKFYPEDWHGFFKKLGWEECETRFTGEISLEFNRKPPMPFWASLILPFMPKKIREASLRMTGYVVFKRKS